MSYKKYLIEKLNEAVEDWKDVTGQKIKSSIKDDIKLKSGDIIPKGTKIEFVFVQKSDNGPYAIKVINADNDKVKIPTFLSAYSQKVTAINKLPGEKALEKYVMDDVVPTVTGKRVEPDGIGPDGSPSWLLALGMI